MAARRLLAITLSGVAALAVAEACAETRAGELTIIDPRAGATAARQATAAAYLTVRNAGAAPDRLVGAASPAAAQVRLHATTVDAQGVAQMRPVDVLQVPAGGEVALDPGGLHLMLEGLTAPLRAGTAVPLVLRFERAGEVRLEVPVRSPREIARGRGHDGH